MRPRRMQHCFELFSSAVDRHPSRIALEFQRRDAVDRVSYGDLRDMAARTAAWLALIGVASGDRCLVLGDNDISWCAAYLGILRRGAVAVPLDTNGTAGQIATVLTDAAPRVAFAGPGYVDVVIAAARTAGVDLKVVVLNGTHSSAVSFDAMTGGRLPAPPLPSCPATPADAAVILYTSGTTGDPKGVVLTHANLLGERDAVLEAVKASDRDCVLGVLPLCQALAQTSNLLLPLSIGARVVYLETVSITEVLRALDERGVTFLAAMPPLFYLIHQRVQARLAGDGFLRRTMSRILLRANVRLRRLGLNMGRLFFRRAHAVLGGQMRLMVTGGSRFEPGVGADLHAMGFTIVQAYGLTETSGAATLTRPGDPDLETVGQPLPGVEIRIRPVEAGDTGTDGEVLVRGPIVMHGYCNNPEATAATLQDGWLHTGDFGRLDADGRLVITGRRKELIVLSSGRNIYPGEVEAAYLVSRFIQEICVLGLGTAGEPPSERLFAVVVPNQALLRERRVVNVGDVIRFEIDGASVRLSRDTCVLGYQIRTEPLPRTSTGQIRRADVARWARAQEAARAAGDVPLSDADQAWLARADVAPVVDAIRSFAKPGTRVTPSANLELDLGFDSIARVEILTAVEQRFGSHIAEADAQQIFTVRGLVDATLATATSRTDDGREPWERLLAPDALPVDRLKEWLQPHSIVPALMLGIVKAIRLLARPGVRVTVTGRHHLPATGGCLLCPNHQSHLDPMALMSILPVGIALRVFFIGATEYFETPLTRWLARQINLVPVDPDAHLVFAMQAGATGLRQGRILVLFPEGERSINGVPKRFKKGAAILARYADVPIVPVGLDGPFDLWPRNRAVAWRRFLPGAGTRVSIAFGPPIPPRTTAQDSMAGEDALTPRLHDEVEQLWKAAHSDRQVSGRPA